MVLDYFYFYPDEKYPILQNLPEPFDSAAILFHPFIQMPRGWEKSRRKREFEHIYPNYEEISTLGTPTSWGHMIKKCGFKTAEEVALALITSIGAFKNEFKRNDLAEKLEQHIVSDFYFPTEDFFSQFLIPDILKVLGSNGAKKIYYFECVECRTGHFEIDKVTPIEIYKLPAYPITLMDENQDFAFTTSWDSFFTLFIARGGKAKKVFQEMNWEGIICDGNTKIDWYFQKYDSIYTGVKMNDKYIYTKIKRILQDMISEKMDIVSGCGELSALYHQGYDFIPLEFDEYYSDLQDIPLPTYYHQWEHGALKTKLKKLESYKEQVILNAKKFLKEVK